MGWRFRRDASYLCVSRSRRGMYFHIRIELQEIIAFFKVVTVFKRSLLPCCSKAKQYTQDLPDNARILSLARRCELNQSEKISLISTLILPFLDCATTPCWTRTFIHHLLCSISNTRQIIHLETTNKIGKTLIFKTTNCNYLTSRVKMCIKLVVV